MVKAKDSMAISKLNKTGPSSNSSLRKTADKARIRVITLALLSLVFYLGYGIISLIRTI